MKFEFIKGYRNHYNFPIGIYICEIKYHLKTLNFRYKHKVWSLLIKY